MIQNISSWIGICAAVPASLPSGPKTRARGSTSDLSLTMLVVLPTGLALSPGYGVLKGDRGTIGANGVGAALSASVLAFKIRDMRSS